MKGLSSFVIRVKKALTGVSFAWFCLEMDEGGKNQSFFVDDLHFVNRWKSLSHCLTAHFDAVLAPHTSGRRSP